MAATITNIPLATQPEPWVHTVVLNWHATEETLGCLTSLRQQTYARQRIVVVDNGSDEASLAPLRADGAPWSFIRNPANLGFAGGVNVGIRAALAAGADYVWLVNNDARACPDALAQLVAAAEADPRIGLLSPVIRDLEQGDRIEFCGGRFNPVPLTFDMTLDPAVYRAWRQEQPERVWLTGTALLLRRAVIERIGLFDEALFAYFEDNDYSFRVAAAGFHNVVVEAATVLHRSADAHGAVPGKRPYFYYYMARNRILLLAKHGGLVRNVRALVWALALQARERKQFRAYQPVADAIAAGVWDGLRRAGGEFAPDRRTVAAGALAIGAVTKLLRLGGALSAPRAAPSRS